MSRVVNLMALELPEPGRMLAKDENFGTVESGYQITQFRAAIGTGVRIYLPQQMFGPLPLAFDIAFPIVKADEDRTRVFTFFIGAFW